MCVDTFATVVENFSNFVHLLCFLRTVVIGIMINFVNLILVQFN